MIKSIKYAIGKIEEKLAKRAKPKTCKACKCIIGLPINEKSYKKYGICFTCQKNLKSVIEKNPKYADSTIHDLISAIEVMREMEESDGFSI